MIEIKPTVCPVCKKPCHALESLRPMSEDGSEIIDGRERRACPACIRELRFLERWEKVCEHRIYSQADPERCDAAKLREVFGFCRPEDESLTLILSGTPRHGKTSLAFLVMKDFMRKGADCFYQNAVRLKRASELQFQADEEGKEQARKLLKRCMDANVLLLDDLGGKSKMSERFEMELYDLFETRVSQGGVTIVTTNCTMRELREWFGVSGEAVFLRLVEDAFLVSF